MQKNLVLIGDPRAYVAALNTPGNDRKTGLTTKLQTMLGIKEKDASDNIITSNTIGSDESTKFVANTDEIPENDYILTKEKIYSGEIDPMIGMEGITLS